MWIPGVETLLVKGFIWIGTHLSASAVAHLGAYVVSHGIIATTTALLTNPIVLSSTVVIGGYVWSQEKVTQANKIIKALSNGDAQTVAVELVKFSGILGKTLSEGTNELVSLLENHYGVDKVTDIVATIKDISKKIPEKK